MQSDSLNFVPFSAAALLVAAVMVPVLRMSPSFVLPVPWHLAPAAAEPTADFTVNEDVPVPFHVILPWTPLAVVPLVLYVATSTPEPPVNVGLLQPPKVLFAV